MKKLLLTFAIVMLPVMAHAGSFDFSKPLATMPLIQDNVAQHAGAKELPDCDDSRVRETLTRVTHLTTIVETKTIRTNDPTKSRFCKSEILASNGRLAEIVYELRWVSESEGRFWLQTQGGRYY